MTFFLLNNTKEDILKNVGNPNIVTIDFDCVETKKTTLFLKMFLSYTEERK